MAVLFVDDLIVFGFFFLLVFLLVFPAAFLLLFPTAFLFSAGTPDTTKTGSTTPVGGFGGRIGGFRFLAHFFGFFREPDQIRHRSPIEPIEPTGPVRFLKRWKFLMAKVSIHLLILCLYDIIVY